MKVTIEKNEVVIRLPLKDAPKETEKMFLIGSSDGFRDAECEYKGKSLRVNAMIGYKKGKE